MLGIIDQSIMKERWLGVAGQPTTLNGVAIQTRPCPELKLAYLYATTPHMFSGEAWCHLHLCICAVPPLFNSHHWVLVAICVAEGGGGWEKGMSR